MEQLYQIDVSLFKLINEGLANPFLDVVMVFLTSFKKSWFIAALTCIYVLVRRKKEGLVILVLFGLAIALADQTASSFFKPLIERTRPCFALENVNLLVRQTRSYSFASSHAANTAAVATLIWIFFSKSGRTDRLFALAVAVYAVLVGYSRIYVGVHYPSDVLGGMVIGVASGSLVYLAYSYTMKNYIHLHLAKTDRAITKTRF
ncbi:MAG: phosphatase PAP2 family protein [Chlorobiales bacterium]|jgi:undecaprenyl-diphosphatase|nr:phosphatase PAP2 family protein [Chlorobiales bacterium]